jgi:tetratricopeptide (TPR) repeat protein
MRLRRNSSDDASLRPKNPSKAPTPASPPTKPQPAPPTVTAVRKRSRLRQWLFRLIAVVVVPAIFLTLLELGLRVFGFGHPTSFFVERPGPNLGETVHAENVEFGKLYFPPGLVKVPLTLSMPTASKSDRTYRIFVLGESAAQGFPDPSASFARVLEAMLRSAFPETRFEVYDTAVTAINSHVIRAIAKECAGYQPDLFVVFMGNNEVVGPFGAAGTLGAYTPSLGVVRTSLTVKRTRVGQLLGLVKKQFASDSGPKSWDGMAMFQKSRLTADDPRLDEMLANFRGNLNDVIAAGTDAGAEVVVCTVPVNLRDSAPFASEHRSGLDATELGQWEAFYNEGIRLEAAGQHVEAIKQYVTAAAIDDRFAELQFRLARCCAKHDKPDAARAYYLAARDLDALRFRSDTRINETIRDVDGSRPKVHLVDAEREFQSLSPDGVPGHEFFLEHVHMNFHGNHAVAAAIYRTLTHLNSPLLRNGKLAPPPPLSESECADRLVYTNFSRLRTESNIRLLLFDPPFNGQLDHEETEKRSDARVAELQAKLQPADVAAIDAAYERVLRDDPDNWMTRENYALFLNQTGRAERALEEYMLVTRRLPHHYEAMRQQGMLQQETRRPKEAVASLEAAIKVNPDFTAAYYDLAYVLGAQGKVAEGDKVFRERVADEPDRPEALANYARFLIQFGKTREAKEQLDAALAIDPAAPHPNKILGDYLATEGKTDEAIDHYETAVKSRPRLRPEVNGLIEKLRGGKK